MLLTTTDLFDIMARIRFNEPGWHIVLNFDGYRQPYLAVHATTKDNHATGDMTWSGRKWRLSFHMTPGEIVQTAFMAIMAAQEHETREKFTYRGVSIFDPHYDIERLVELRRDPNATQERT